MLSQFVSMALLLGAAPALAQSQPADQPTSPAKGKSANRMICEKIEQIGSRLASKRICMTAEQWAEKRRVDRDELQAAQMRGSQPSGN